MSDDLTSIAITYNFLRSLENLEIRERLRIKYGIVATDKWIKNPEILECTCGRNMHAEIKELRNRLKLTASLKYSTNENNECTK